MLTLMCLMTAAFYALFAVKAYRNGELPVAGFLAFVVLCNVGCGLMVNFF